MMTTEPVRFDLRTVNFLSETIDDAWDCLRPEQRATTTRSELAERILKTAARGERDRRRLINAALTERAA